MGLKNSELGLQLALPQLPAQIAFSVMEVRNALRCPRVFALGRARKHAVVFPIGSSSLGAMFHRIVEGFALELASPPEPVRRLPDGASREQLTRLFTAWLLGHLVGELKACPEAASMPGEIDDLAEALRGLAGSLALLVEVAGQPLAEALRLDLGRAEGELSAVLERPSGASVRLVGRAAELLGSAEGAPFAVELKPADEANQDLDRAQVAVYRALLKKALESDVTPALHRYRPALQMTNLSLGEADALVTSRVARLVEQMVGWDERPDTAPMTARRDLCAVCPQREPCKEMFPERHEARDNALADSARLVPDPDGKLVLSAGSEPIRTSFLDMEGRAEADALSDRIVAELRRQEVRVTVKGKTVGPRLLHIEVLCPGTKVAKLDRAVADVEHQLAHENVKFERKGARRFFSAPRKAPRSVDLATLLARKADFLRERPGRFVVGEDLDGEVLTGDLSDGSACHLLIGGQTGSGKSVLLQSIISSLCHFHPPSMIRFTLVDPKRVTFGKFAASIAAHLTGPVMYDAETLLPVLDDLVVEMESRYERMEHCQAQNIDDYNAVNAEKLDRRVVVVDEFQDLIAAKALRQRFLDVVKRLGAKARAAGIHLILATQRPDKNTVPGEIKANLCGRIALKVQEGVNSRILLDQPGAEHLLGRGDLLANLGHGIVRAQAPLV
jgi:DNA segregation ATPase FtsK/SpoIIIE, S-DNA-T family